jgi:NADH dehydrogenase [ubiquinone] 1 alpha subcomplex assembly factor 7
VDAGGRAPDPPTTTLGRADTLVGLSAAVAARIRRAIEERGPISFGEFMDLALYGPGGFYDQPPVGRGGHFLTSPHVHPVFAELLLRAVLDLRDRLGRPEPLPIVEVGAGDGTLAATLLRLLEERGGPAVDYAVVERSPGARAALADLPVRVIERMGVAEHPDAMVVVANELLDNLPFRRVRGTSDGAVEIRIDADRDGFVEVDVPCDAKVAKFVAEQGPLAPSQEVIVPIGALGFVDELATTIRRGYALLIDYGSARGPASDVHGYREHRVLEDVLRDPGSADITAGVDFGAIVRRAERGGLQSLGLASQRDALLALGFAEWNAVQLDRQGSLLARGEGGPATRVWEGRGRASLLVDPGGLGRQKWLLLATDRLPAPTWIGPVESLD